MISKRPELGGTVVLRRSLSHCWMTSQDARLILETYLYIFSDGREIELLQEKIDSSRT